MVDQDILYEKVAIIQRCLKRIADTTKLRPEKLDDLMVQDVFVLNLQRAVQAAIDLAAHIVTTLKLGLPASLKDHFELLSEGKILSKKLVAQMKAMVGFRNIAVHEYQDLDIKILKSILKNHLGDLEQYCHELLKHFAKK